MLMTVLKVPTTLAGIIKEPAKFIKYDNTI